MSNNYKFRVWHKDKKHMYDNVAVGMGENVIGFMMSNKSKYYFEKTEGAEVCQYTGFKDQDGKQIYTKDIVKFGNDDNDIAVVVWEDYKLMFKTVGSNKLVDKFGNWSRIKYKKIIGNSFENPELLNKK